MPYKRVISPEKFREKILKYAARRAVPREKRKPCLTNADLLIEGLFDAALGYSEKVADERGNQKTVRYPPSPSARAFLVEQIGGKPSSVPVQAAGQRITALDKTRALAVEKLNTLAKTCMKSASSDSDSESEATVAIPPMPVRPAKTASPPIYEPAVNDDEAGRAESGDDDDPDRFDPDYEPKPEGR